ncbi:hypothetical protein FG379_000189 [Cryptosporidium bovis]|uniref:uncharacterized protein n=1 Tax=Cryptosporidium bovis TaxID=310047 RepID=UPI00351A6F42|nr:hypothetical protein FG379_000189 [Cryptosporidium bovis]
MLSRNVLAEVQDESTVDGTGIQRNLRITPFNISAVLLVFSFTSLVIFIVGLAMDTDTPTRFEEKAPPIMKEY